MLARVVLYFLSWSGFLVSFMMRNDMNFAINAMVNITFVEFDENSSSSNLNRTDNDVSLNEEYPNLWSPAIKSFVLSSFYIWYVLSQVVGGIATQKYGTKKVFGWSQFFTALCSFLMPMACEFSGTAVIILRSIQGFASGLTWPSMYAIVGYWVPLEERSRFMSSFQGYNMGVGLTYPICGLLISHFGWHYVFYATGSFGMLWCLTWYFLAFNTPREHPRISREELIFIEKNLDMDSDGPIGKKVPWKSIFTSWPAWAIALTTFGRIWINYVFVIMGPSFIKNILQFDYTKNGLLSGLPFICSYISSVIFCYIADKLMTKGIMSLTNIRKIFTALSQLVPGVLILLLGYSGDNLPLFVVMWFVAIIFITASYAGAMANIVDIAPKLAGPVLAFCQTIHMTASFLSPNVGSLIVTNEKSITQWRLCFYIASAIAILTYGFFEIFGTAEIQEWNYYDDTSVDLEEVDENSQNSTTNVKHENLLAHTEK